LVVGNLTLVTPPSVGAQVGHAWCDGATGLRGTAHAWLALDSRQLWRL